MMHKIAKVKGMGFILWHSRHEFYHILLGLVWAWFLRERWNEFNPKWIFLAVFGSLLPDLDHFVYFFTYGKKSDYTKAIIKMIRNRQWRALTVFIAQGHKTNTNLYSHNFYIVGAILLFSLLASFWDWQSGVVLFGAIVIHYVFDIIDDYIQLGMLNENWRRWGNGFRRKKDQQIY